MICIRSLSRGLGLLLLVLLFAEMHSAFAATVSGTVLDPSGAAVSGAHIELVSNGQVVARGAADREGHYALSIAGGAYVLRVSASGFKTLRTNMQLRDEDSIARNVTLGLDTLSTDVTVTATATPMLESHLGSAITALDRAQLAGTNEVQDVLRDVPGLQLTQTGRFGGSATLFIRGGNSDANKVLIDGVPMNDIGGGVDFADISSSAIAKVEVLRGPNSSAYGADALAGVVSLSTQRGTTPLPQVTYTGDGGNFGSYHNEAALGGKWRTLDYFSDFSRFDTANGIPGNRFHSTTETANVGWNLFANSSLRATLHHDQIVGGQPNAILLYGIPDNAQQKNEDAYFGATFDTQSTARWHNLVRYGGVRLRSNYTEFGPTGIPYYSGGFLVGYLGAPVTLHGANGYTVSGQALYQYPAAYPTLDPSATDRDLAYAQTDYRVAPHLQALVAFQYESERGYSYATSDSVSRRNSSYTLMFQGDIKGRLFYTLGTGIEDYDLFGVVPTPRISLAYALRQPASRVFGVTRLRASFGKGIKEPSIFEQTDSVYAELQALANGAQLISQFHIGQIGPEWSRTYDGGVDQELFGARARIGLTYFHNEFTNGIEYIPTLGLIQLGVPAEVAYATNFGAYVNSQAFRAQGVEAELQYQIRKDLFVRGGYTYLDAVVQRSFSSDAIGPTFNPNIPNVPIGAYSPLIGARPFRRAPHSGYFGVSYTHARFSAAVNGTLVGTRDDSDFLGSDANYLPTLLLPNRNLDGAYQRLDLHASYAFSPRFQIVSRVQNLLSERYSEAFGYPALPFTFRTGVQLTLGGESWKLR